MSLPCSVLGHAFGESEVERDTDHRGEETVVTERECRYCRRCGTRTVVSESVQVTIAGDEPEAAPNGEPAGDSNGSKTATDESETAPNGEQAGDSDDAETATDEPEAEDAGRPTPGPWPDVDGGADEGFAAAARDVDRPLVDRGEGLAPEDEVVVGPTDTDDAGATPTALLGAGSRDDDVVYVCSDCTFTVQATRSAIVPGDICPDCRAGYVEERTR